MLDVNLSLGCYRLHALRGQPGQEMTGKVHRFDLKTGDLKIVPAQERHPEGWYKGEISAYPLRFSSLTDILRPDLSQEGANVGRG